MMGLSPSTVLISADSVRSDTLVSEATHTPNLDRLRNEGIEFRSAIAPVIHNLVRIAIEYITETFESNYD